uniref:Uncharacterized protein n=1 Tax=Arundo donax TaxID=35708 RepID=A0A0A9FJY1_ARUDO
MVMFISSTFALFRFLCTGEYNYIACPKIGWT